VRHRIASFSQESQRYSDPLITADEDWAVIPDSILEKPEAKRLVEEFLEEAKKMRQQLDSLVIQLEDSR
jgi:thymidylate synthase ThyX